MGEAKVGIQLIIYRERTQKDLAGVLRECATAGYVGIEAGNLFQMHDPQQVKEALAETGLKVAGMHTNYNGVSTEAQLAEHFAYLQAVNSSYLICSGVAPGKGIGRYETAAKTFNRVGARCRDEGLVFCYHNHAWEFESFNGVKGIHRLAELTNPELVKLCVDVYWVHVGGEDPAAFIRRYANRGGYYHFKDGAPGSFTELGRGEVNLTAAKDAALEAGAVWIVYEQDRTDKVVRDSIVESREYLRTLGL